MSLKDQIQYVYLIFEVENLKELQIEIFPYDGCLWCCSMPVPDKLVCLVLFWEPELKYWPSYLILENIIGFLSRFVF